MGEVADVRIRVDEGVPERHATPSPPRRYPAGRRPCNAGSPQRIDGDAVETMIQMFRE
jgi:hypothetical protein